LLPEVACFVLMGRILYILRSGSAAVKKADLLWQLVLEHHDKFMSLYPGSAKIKLHLLLHIPGLLKQYGVNLSCFAAERKHKASKHIASFAFNRWYTTMLHRDLAATFELWAQPGTFEEYWMVNAVAIDWAQLLAGGGAAVKLAELGAHEQSAALRSPVGTMHWKDLVAFTTAAGFEVGFLAGVFKVRDGSILAAVDVLARISETVYSLDVALSRTSLVAASVVRGSFPYLPLDGDTIFLVASADSFT
jgi:hypothetical protein